MATRGEGFFLQSNEKVDTYLACNASSICHPAVRAAHHVHLHRGSLVGHFSIFSNCAASKFVSILSAVTIAACYARVLTLAGVYMSFEFSRTGCFWTRSFVMPRQTTLGLQ